MPRPLLNPDATSVAIGDRLTLVCVVAPNGLFCADGEVLEVNLGQTLSDSPIVLTCVEGLSYHSLVTGEVIDITEDASLRALHGLPEVGDLIWTAYVPVPQTVDSHTVRWTRMRAYELGLMPTSHDRTQSAMMLEDCYAAPEL
jgi:hypothetical protein